MPDTIDHEALRRKYREERDKRLRPEGSEQYVQPTGRFASLLEDPYCEVAERDPVEREVTVAIMGAGFAGLLTAARLTEAGVRDMVILETGGDVGGVWYWNRYPGAMCDTASMVYLPLLEETGHVPSMKYVFAPEIWEHAKRIARTYDLYPHALFSTSVTSMEWDDADHRWVIRTNRGDTIRARYVSVGPGPLNRPHLPGIPGLDTFAGHSFHTSRWDYAYTGGDPAGAPMTELADRRVGIIGTGATAVQCIPRLARDAGELFVFQRTPSSVDERNNHPIDPEWFATLEPGWQRRWLANFAVLQTGGFADEDLVKDGWTDIAQRIRDRVVDEINAGAELTPETFQRAFDDSDDEKMTEIRARVDAIVEDPATAEALKPWYRQLCKRPCFHDEYLQSYNLPSVHLVDTDGKGVERIDESGVWVAGTHHELDCLIYASGFEFGTEMAQRCGYETVGRDGETLSQHWAHGMRSLHGIQVHGFPNLFIVGFAQGSFFLPNFSHNHTEVATTIAAVIAHGEAVGAEVVEVTREAEDDWVSAIAGTSPGIFGNLDCTPGYYNNEGQPIEDGERLNSAGDPRGPIAFWDHLERWRTSGDFAGLDIS